MKYKIIIYRLIIFKVQQQKREIKKRYFQKIKTINDIDTKDLSNKNIELKKLYRDNFYIFSILKEDEDDTYFNNLNNKSYKYYVDYVGGNYGK